MVCGGFCEVNLIIDWVNWEQYSLHLVWCLWDEFSKIKKNGWLWLLFWCCLLRWLVYKCLSPCLEVMLMQKEKMIAYVSWQLKDYKSQYHTHDLELVAVLFALKIWQHYLYRVKCNVYTDHKSLKYFFTQKELNMRQR